MLVDRDDDLFVINLHPFRHGVENALIGLMRNKPVNLLRAQTSFIQHGLDRRGDVGDSMAEYPVSFHTHVTDRSRRAYTTIYIEQIGFRTIGPYMMCDYPGIISASPLLSLQHDRTAAVAEKNASSPI